MAAETTERRSGSLQAFHQVLANPGLRRIQLAWAGSNLGTWGYGVALAVYAYAHGGATAVGLVGLIRLLPAAIAAPFMGVLGDRHSRRLVMVLSDLARVVVVGVAGVAILMDAPAAVIYVLAALGVVISTAFRPAQAAMIPSLATSPDELTASNVVSSSIEAIGMFAGPAIGGLLLAVSGPAVVFFVAAGTFLWSAVLILRLHEPPRATSEKGEEDAHPSFLRQALEGFGTVVKEPTPRLLMSLFSAQTFVAGALLVFLVVVALELLGKGDGWVGVLSASFGVGGILGAVISGALVRRARLALDFGTGLLLWGLPLALIALWPNPVVAVVTMALMGVGNTLVDVSGMTLLQRSVPDDLLARVFGVLETTFLFSVSVGSIVTPAIVHAFGSRTALIVVGSFLPLILILFGRHLFRLDASLRIPERELALLRGISFFAPLPQPALEALARRLVPVHVPGGTQIVRMGEVGDRFYIVADGEVEISKHGEPVTRVGPGGYFGEIALLHEVPRQADATALVDSELFALEGEDFVAGVTGYAPSRDAAAAVVRSYGLSLGIPGSP